MRPRSKDDKKEEFIDGAKGDKDARKEGHVNYPLRLRESLDERLRDYADNYAKRGESLNAIINRAVENELDRLEAEVGERERLLAKGKKVERAGGA